MGVLSDPAVDGVAVTLGSDFPIPREQGFCRALYIGSAGDVVLVTRAGTQLTFVAHPGGKVLPCGAITVKSTANGTTASDIIALY
jgi:hypothetical protein